LRFRGSSSIFDYLLSLVFPSVAERVYPPEKLFDEIIKAKIAFSAIALESELLQKF
jgi:hypothetical protein